jgi:hypothetical protein
MLFGVPSDIKPVEPMGDGSIVNRQCIMVLVQYLNFLLRWLPDCHGPDLSMPSMNRTAGWLILGKTLGLNVGTVHYYRRISTGCFMIGRFYAPLCGVALRLWRPGTSVVDVALRVLPHQTREDLGYPRCRPFERLVCGVLKSICESKTPFRDGVHRTTILSPLRMA